MDIEAVIFDLDGVLVHTDHYHYLAWKRMCDEEGIPFDEAINDRLRGIGRMACVNIVLEKASRRYSQQEKMHLAERKNGYYKERLQSLSAADLPSGIVETLDTLREKRIKLAVGSSSKNAPYILERLGLSRKFDVVADGNDICRSKPDPEVFLLAASKLGVRPDRCLVIEDAAAGVEAAFRGGMWVAAIGEACVCDMADYQIGQIEELLPILQANGSVAH
ncbi:beta-phosphoglucomutase [Paenibacillus chitinolyticus]|uniref:beta-phosphoglucomutase n=1 Tax=Paenibacillus chitinolyticus TaxID=79263 RepID=UPI0026E4B3BE|nr:beta-phosphoglucomutase [Paenibacillus chitinolyticus]GKS15046.1 beta-phosphoglucomutase [Paenibacillus chitinolyticus]